MPRSPRGQCRSVNPSAYAYAGSNPAPATQRKGPLMRLPIGGPSSFPVETSAPAYFRTISPQAAVDARTRPDTAVRGRWGPVSATRRPARSWMRLSMVSPNAAMSVRV
jgi:hypothetical protein